MDNLAVVNTPNVYKQHPRIPLFAYPPIPLLTCAQMDSGIGGWKHTIYTQQMFANTLPAHHLYTKDVCKHHPLPACPQTNRGIRGMDSLYTEDVYKHGGWGDEYS